MNTNDQLLTFMIQQDMAVNKTCFKQITDVVVHNPIMIEVQANEVVYIHFIDIKPKNEGYKLSLQSPNFVQFYNRNNMINGSSNHISKHWGNIKFKGKLPANYYVHYVRIKL